MLADGHDSNNNGEGKDGEGRGREGGEGGKGGKGKEEGGEGGKEGRKEGRKENGGLRAFIESLVQSARGKTVEEAAQEVPMVDVWVGRHELLYSRIFNS